MYFIFLTLIVAGSDGGPRKPSGETQPEPNLATRCEQMVEAQYEYNRKHHALLPPQIALKEAMEKQSVEALLPLLTNRMPEIREAAAYVIRLRPDDERDRDDVRRAVTAALEKETNAYVLPDFIYLACVSKAEDAVPSMTRVLLSSRPDELRRTTAHLLGECRFRSAAPALLKATNDKSEQVSGAALWALITIEDSSVIPVLRRLSRDTRSSHRWDAIVGLGILKDAESAAYLEELCKSTDTRAVLTALRAIGHLQAERSVNNVALLLNHSNDEIRKGAMDALLKIGGEKSLQVFLKRYQANTDDEAALESISRLYKVYENLPQPTLEQSELKLLAVALSSANPKDKVDPKNIVNVWQIDDWYFIRTRYDSSGHIFIARNEKKKWLQVRCIGRWGS